MDCTYWPIWQIRLLDFSALLVANVAALTAVWFLVIAVKKSFGNESFSFETVTGRYMAIPLAIVSVTVYAVILGVILVSLAGLLCSGHLGIAL